MLAQCRNVDLRPIGRGISFQDLDDFLDCAEGILPWHGGRDGRPGLLTVHASLHALAHLSMHTAAAALHHLAMHVAHHAALLHMTVHAHRPVGGRKLRGENISGSGDDHRARNRRLPGKFRHREPLSRYAPAALLAAAAEAAYDPDHTRFGRVMTIFPLPRLTSPARSSAARVR